MSIFSVKSTLDNPSWVSGSTNFNAIPLSSLRYTKYSDQTMLYCNHPETVSSTYLGDNNYCINKATINTSEALLYASCNSGVNSVTKFVVRVYNPNSYSVTIKKVNSGFNCTNNWYPQVGTYESFFNAVSVSNTIPAHQSVWIEDESVLANGRFEALMKYTLTGTLVMAVYLCKNKNNIGDNPSYPPISKNEYSGTASAFYISTSNTLAATDLLASYYNSAFYGIFSKNFSGNSTESNPITLLQGGTASEDSSTYNNVGNYGLQYAFSTTLKNDKTSGRVKFKGYVISNPEGHCAGISSGGVAKAMFLGTNGAGSGAGYNRWNFCETNAINPGKSITLDYQYMHLGRGCTPGIIQWETVEV